MFTMEVGRDDDAADVDEGDDYKAADPADDPDDDDEGSQMWYDVTRRSMSHPVKYLRYGYSRTRVSTIRYDSLHSL